MLSITRAAATPYRPPHMLSTIMHVLFDIGELRLDPSIPNDVSRVITQNEKIEPLFG